MVCLFRYFENKRMRMKHKVVVAITGASGSIYADELLKKLLSIPDQLEAVDIVMSKNAKLVWKTELDSESYADFPFRMYEPSDFHAPFASGSSRYNSMIIAPCSMGTLARIAGGISNDLITRAADVMLKERRKLILMPREAPYNLIHLKNMQTVMEAGGIICPATPSFYHKPTDIKAVVMTVVDRLLDLCGFEIDSKRWGKTAANQENKN